MMHSLSMARSPGVDRGRADDRDGAPDRERSEPRNSPPSPGNSATADACPQLIDLDADAKDKHELFKIAVAMLHGPYAIDPAPILRALWRREEAGSTGLGLGIAIPHARVPGIAGASP